MSQKSQKVSSKRTIRERAEQHTFSREIRLIDNRLSQRTLTSAVIRAVEKIETPLSSIFFADNIRRSLSAPTTGCSSNSTLLHAALPYIPAGMWAPRDRLKREIARIYLAHLFSTASRDTGWSLPRASTVAEISRRLHTPISPAQAPGSSVGEVATKKGVRFFSAASRVHVTRSAIKGTFARRFLQQ